VTLEESFWAKVIKAGPDDCWGWAAGRDDDGYGQFRVTGRRRCMGSHRFSWELHFGAIPEDLQVLHRCDNPPCVNPAHLFLGTNQDNHNDKMAKGRQAKGERNPGAKLTETQVIEIREVIQDDGLAALARKYGVSKTQIRRIASGISWPHVSSSPITVDGRAV
jgi:hypothetical protein